MILWAANQAAASIAVCSALKDAMLDLGAADNKILVLRNGVDLDLFKPSDRAVARVHYGMRGFAIASVGHLIDRKGHDLVIKALPMMADATLHIAGEGPDEGDLRSLAVALGVADRVHFLGSLSQEALREFYSAADCLALASSREGWANVLLEAMACGTPVVASNVWGTPEIVAAPEAGILMRERSPSGVARGVQALRSQYPDRAATRRYAERFSWDDTTSGQMALFESVVSRTKRRMDWQ
jgi:glycosyltransferase involved in cell wall biosynthesis